MLYGGFAAKGKKLSEAVEKSGDIVKKKADDVLEEAATNIIRHFDDAIEDGVSNNITRAIKDGILDKDIVEELGDEIKDIAASKSKKLSWEEVQALFKRGNDFNRKVNNMNPPKYQFNEVTVEQMVNGQAKKFRLDGYNEGFEIVSRKATDFDNIQTSTFEKYCDELLSKYKVGTKITAPKYLELNGKTLQGKYKLEVPKSNEISSKLDEFRKIADDKGIEIIFEVE
ncbi:hypothetical protein FACS189429_6440 [Bacteroidia bacterium]|nr:hypothetical protein FACS189429_6440 [Bacteroidia bacterium]GHV46829.1 hypothetical protein FACS1894180_9480 [Bacteroidia bacterium]